MRHILLKFTEKEFQRLKRVRIKLEKGRSGKWEEFILRLISRHNTNNYNGGDNNG